MLVFAGLVCVLLVLAAFCADRTGYVDELGLYNPAYMLARHGNLTYPAYGLFENIVVIHPPVHVGIIGLFERMGFTWYYAEAMPAFLWFLLAIVATVRGRFPAFVKLGLLFSIAFVLHGTGPAAGFGFNIFGTRPEGHVHAAWLTGLILLESGRQENWRKSKLFAGAFALAWASGVLYYAVASCLGVVVYMIAAIRQLGWRKALPAVGVLAGGACLFGLPFVFLFLLPNQEIIKQALTASQVGGGISESIKIHVRIYREWVNGYRTEPVIAWAARTGVPLAAFSTAILAAIRRTRVLALAALPLQAFLYLFASHKHEDYFIHEVAFFGLALAMGMLALAAKLASRMQAGAARQAILPLSAGLLCLYLAIGNRTLEAADFTLRPHMHEGDLARAASREMLGRGASVTSIITLWYASGAAYWSFLPKSWPIQDESDAGRLFECFDAAAASEFASAQTDGRQWQSLSSQYAAGTLKLRGFFFGYTDRELQFVLLHPHPPGPLAGYAAVGDRLFRFDERADGDHEVILAVCPDVPGAEVDQWREHFAKSPSAVLYLPQPRSDGAVYVATVLAVFGAREPAGMIGRSCRVISRVRGALREVDKYALVDGLRRTDPPMEFYRGPIDTPGCGAHFVGPAGLH